MSAKRIYLSVSLAIVSAICLIGGGVALSQGSGGAQSDVTPIKADDVQACMDCHSEDQEKIKAVNLAALKTSQHKELKCQDCHSSVTGAPHSTGMMKEKPACVKCHTDEAEKFSKCSHSNKDIVPGDHPTCVSCHSDTSDPHNVRPVASWSRTDRVKLCSSCHSQKERMARYRVDTDAVQSYDDSFHGKALLAFGYQKAAICTDCHGEHTVLPPSDPNALTNRANGDKLCARCHQGAKANFAMSGANHLRLKMKQDPVLAGIDIFFRIIVLGVLGFMLCGIVLDIRRKVFGAHPPKSGRVVGVGIALSFMLAILALTLAVFNQLHLTAMLGMAGIGLLIVSYIVYKLTPAGRVKRQPKKFYPRLSLEHRIQHIFLMLSFTTLIMTGMPLKFYQANQLQVFQAIFGGMQGARMAHRVAAIFLILVFLWHTTDLFVKWAKSGFSFKGWTMVPNKKDLIDFIRLSEYYLGLIKEEPKFDKFAFKQKLDYLAEYWGVPLMVVTGFILWFPIYWGNRLPEIAVSAALVAHGWEATLAFLAIITWHMYNEHFNPASFPMSKVWWTGTMDEEEMEREHPIEKERLDREGQSITPTEPGVPELRPSPNPSGE